MKTKKYKVRNGYYFKRVDAQIIGEQISELMNRNNNKITPNLIVDTARNKKNPLHKYFEWNDSVAGEKWRLQQARLMMGGIVEEIKIEGVRKDFRSFHSVIDKKEGQVYVTLDSVIKNKSYAKQLLENAESYIDHLLGVIKLLKEHL